MIPSLIFIFNIRLGVLGFWIINQASTGNEIGWAYRFVILSSETFSSTLKERALEVRRSFELRRTERDFGLENQWAKIIEEK